MSDLQICKCDITDHAPQTVMFKSITCCFPQATEEPFHLTIDQSFPIFFPWRNRMLQQYQIACYEDRNQYLGQPSQNLKVRGKCISYNSSCDFTMKNFTIIYALSDNLYCPRLQYNVTLTQVLKQISWISPISKRRFVCSFSSGYKHLLKLLVFVSHENNYICCTYYFLFYV